MATKFTVPRLTIQDFDEDLRSTAAVLASTRSNVSHFSIHTPCRSPAQRNREQDPDVISPSNSTPTTCTSPCPLSTVELAHASTTSTPRNGPSTAPLTPIHIGQDEASFCMDEKEYWRQKVLQLEAQLRERTRTADYYADRMSQLAHENREIENNIAAQVACQSQFLQDFSLFLAANQAFPRATSMAQFKCEIAKRIGQCTPRQEEQSERFYRAHGIDDYSTAVLAAHVILRSLALTRDSLVMTRNVVGDAVATLTALPMKAAGLPFRLAKSVVGSAVRRLPERI